jgi:hypothetical protein
MPSRINVNVPAHGKATTASQRENWSIAHEEITELQTRMDNNTGIGEVPGNPLNEVWARKTGAWVVLSNYLNVDGGTFP